MDLGLSGKVVIVTGGASGIGEAIVRTFVAEGAIVAIVDRDREKGARLADELNQQQDGQDGPAEVASFVHADLCDLASIEQAVSATVDHYGRIDVVVNNAGTNDSVGLDQGPEAFEASLRLNLTHYFAIVHHCSEQLRGHQGAIVNVSSKVSVTGQGGTSGYAAAKGAINALTREWAVDFAADGVRVNTVVPAEVWTPMYANWLSTLENPAEEKSRIAARIPLGRRFTESDELARVAVFLASSAASHVTGQIVHVDGGYTHLDRRI